jgi:hypothetical protein
MQGTEESMSRKPRDQLPVCTPETCPLKVCALIKALPASRIAHGLLLTTSHAAFMSLLGCIASLFHLPHVCAQRYLAWCRHLPAKLRYAKRFAQGAPL